MAKMMHHRRPPAQAGRAMKKILFRSAILLAFLLAACTASEPEQPAPSVEQVEQVQGPLEVTSEALGIRFIYPSQLTNWQTGEFPPTEYWEAKHGPIYGEIIHVGDPSDGLADWAVPTTVVEKTRQSPSCGLLAEPNVYLSVAFEEPSSCDVYVSDDGTVVYYAVGFGRPHEGFVFRDSILLAVPPTGDTLVMLQGIAPIDAFPKAAIDILD